MTDDKTPPTRVTLREHYSGFANVPNGWSVLGVDVDPTPKNKDDGTGRDVVVELPEGLRVSESAAGSLEFYDASGTALLLCAARGYREGRPALLCDNGYRALREVTP